MTNARETAPEQVILVQRRFDNDSDHWEDMSFRQGATVESLVRVLCDNRSDGTHRIITTTGRVVTVTIGRSTEYVAEYH